MISISCKSLKKNIDISGNWYSCARNGDYIEMFVKGNNYKYSSNFGVVTKWDEFKISGDTLIQFDTNVYEDSLIINKAIIEFIDQDQFILSYITSVETWEMHRINGEVDTRKTDKETLEGTMQRAVLIACQDLRTEEEKREESLDEIIDFQF